MEVYHQNKSKAVQVLSAISIVLVLATGAFAYLAWQNKERADSYKNNVSGLENQVNTLKSQNSPAPSSLTSFTPSSLPSAKPSPVDASTFKEDLLPSSQKVTQKIAADINGDGQQEVVAWIEDNTKVGYLAHGGKDDGTYHPIHLQVWSYVDGAWSAAFTYTNKQIGNGCGIQTSVPPAVDVFELYPSSLAIVRDGQAELPFVKFKCGGGSGFNQSWFVLDWSHKDVLPLWPSYDKKPVNYANVVNVTGTSITDRQGVFASTDSHYGPTGGTDIIVWQASGGALTKVSNTHTATNIDLNSER